ncbi:hypothetical protein RvY_11697-1 [Ramazzottius varieornatus]|uniref:Uncharacterized protein n=1 Tax=Ramazzottius varieornatus TaxID=947166 RepID=A0A1D1VPQ5_RAMVA|nr:hypothetical protein RvY_11697-1 [Ramazzottius varieornatus]
MSAYETFCLLAFFLQFRQSESMLGQPHVDVMIILDSSDIVAHHHVSKIHASQLHITVRGQCLVMFVSFFLGLKHQEFHRQSRIRALASVPYRNKKKRLLVQQP